MTSSLPQQPLLFAFHFFKKQRLLIIGCVIAALSVNAGIPLALYFIGRIVDAVAVHDESRAMIWSVVTPYIWGMTLAYVFMDAVPSRMREYLITHIEKRMMYDVRVNMVAYLMQHSITYFQNDFAGRLSAKAMDVANSLMRILRVVLNNTFDALFTVVFTTFLFFTVHWVFGVIILVWAFVFAGFTVLTTPKIHGMARDMSEARSRLGGALVDIISNVASVASFARTDHENDVYRARAENLKHVAFKHNIFIAHTAVFKEFMWQILLAPLIIFMIFQWQKGFITAGDIAMMVPMLLGVARTMWMLSNTLVDAFSEYGMLCDAVQTIVVPHNQTQGTKELQPSKPSKIDFEHMTFKHDGAGTQQILFENFDLHVVPGQKIGLIGRSGAGKSTLVNLILRFFDVQGGRILIDDQDIAQVTQESLRRHIAVIQQDISLFHRTLMDNIRYGRLDASDAEVIEAAKKAHADEFIAELPQGYQTFVGERGIKLSGGQRQRIVIARAILKNAPILVLDEATSALDSQSELLIQDSLKELMKDKTVIAIAHRLSTIAHLDRLIVLDQGKIVADGAHEALLAQCGLYKTLWDMQSSGFLGG